MQPYGSSSLGQCDQPECTYGLVAAINWLGLRRASGLQRLRAHGGPPFWRRVRGYDP
jgi:hypothetical protein